MTGVQTCALPIWSGRDCLVMFVEEGRSVPLVFSGFVFWAENRKKLHLSGDQNIQGIYKEYKEYRRVP